MTEFSRGNSALVEVLQERIREQEEEIRTLRRGIDVIKVRSYELGHRTIHDMALALLRTQRDEA